MNRRLYLKEYSRAVELFSQGLDIAVATGSKYLKALALDGLIACHTDRSEWIAARRLQVQALSTWIELGPSGFICRQCAFASATLAMLGALHHAAVAYFGAMHQATSRGTVFDEHQQNDIDRAITRLEAAVESGEITAEDLAAWRTEGEALNLDDLAQYVLAALRE